MFLWNLVALASILFELWHIKITHVLIILCVTLWAPQPPTPPGHTFILCTVTFLLYILMIWDFLLFQRRHIKLQIDTKVIVQGLVKVLQKINVKHMANKVNTETTPPYLRDQFMTCNPLSILCENRWRSFKLIFYKVYQALNKNIHIQS